MDNARPVLETDDLHQLRWALGNVLAMLSASCGLFLDLDVVPWVLAVLVAGVTVCRWPTLPGWIPSWGHRLAFPLIVVAVTVDFYGGTDTLTALVRVQLLLLTYRIISYRKRRDDLQVVLLGLFLVVLTGVMTLSLAFAVQLFAFTGCALALLLVTTLADVTRGVNGTADTVAAGAGHRSAPAWAAELRWGRLLRRLRSAIDWRIVALAVGLFGGVVAVTAMLFTAIPRFELGRSFFLDQLITKKTRTGFSESIQFGDVTRIQEDTSVAFTVDGASPDRLPGVPYWRMVVLDEHRDGGFRSSAGLRAELARRSWQRRAAVEGGVTGLKGSRERWTFYLEPGISRYLPLTGAYRELRFNRPMNFQQNIPLRMVALVNDPSELVGFEITGMESSAILPDAVQAERTREAAEAAGLGYWRVAASAEDRARLKQWVNEIQDGDDLTAEAFAQRAARWLAARHRYGLESELPAGSGDAVVRWLEGRGPGHCELFAAGFALLARTAGHPARLVTGFKGGSWNEFSGSLIVRNSMAHAWCELWDGSGAWIRVDPTPGAYAVGDPDPELAAAQQRSRTIDGGWGARLDGPRVFWYRRVVNFDQAAQLELVEDVRGGVRLWLERGRTWLKGVSDDAMAWVKRPRSAEQWRVVLIFFVALPLSLWAGLRWGEPALWWLVARLRGRGRRGQAAVRREAARWLRRLPPGRGMAGEVSRVRAELEALRFGRPVERDAARHIFVRARQAVRGARWRRP
jgi:hypothetical protein